MMGQRQYRREYLWKRAFVSAVVVRAKAGSFSVLLAAQLLRSELIPLETALRVLTTRRVGVTA